MCSRPSAPGPAAPDSGWFRWLGHGTLLIPGPPCVVVDPWKWRLKGVTADLVLVTRSAADHCCDEDLRAVAGENTVAVGPPPAMRALERVFGERAQAVRAGRSVEHDGLVVDVLPARGPVRAGRPSGFLTRESGVSYRIHSAGGTLLHLGASDALAEHEGDEPDVLLVSVGGMLALDPSEAAAAAARVRPRLAIPVLWGDVSGLFAEASEFVRLCEQGGVSARVLGGS